MVPPLFLKAETMASSGTVGILLRLPKSLSYLPSSHPRAINSPLNVSLCTFTPKESIWATKYTSFLRVGHLLPVYT